MNLIKIYIEKKNGRPCWYYLDNKLVCGLCCKKDKKVSKNTKKIQSRNGTHVSDTVYCPRQVVFRKLNPRLLVDQKTFFFYLRGESIHQGIEELLHEYNEIDSKLKKLSVSKETKYIV